METDPKKTEMPEAWDQLLVYSFNARASLIRRVQNLANEKCDGNRSKMIVELLEKGLEAN